MVSTAQKPPDFDAVLMTAFVENDYKNQSFTQDCCFSVDGTVFYASNESDRLKVFALDAMEAPISNGTPTCTYDFSSALGIEWVRPTMSATQLMHSSRHVSTHCLALLDVASEKYCAFFRPTKRITSLTSSAASGADGSIFITATSNGPVEWWHPSYPGPIAKTDSITIGDGIVCADRLRTHRVGIADESGLIRLFDSRKLERGPYSSFIVDKVVADMVLVESALFVTGLDSHVEQYDLGELECQPPPVAINSSGHTEDEVHREPSVTSAGSEASYHGTQNTMLPSLRTIASGTTDSNISLKTQRHIVCKPAICPAYALFAHGSHDSRVYFRSNLGDNARERVHCYQGRHFDTVARCEWNPKYQLLASCCSAINFWEVKSTGLVA